MLAGEPPFTGPTPQIVIARRFTETPRPLGTMRERLPEGLDQLVARALARTPADRIRTAAEFAHELARTGTASTAVLPFRNLGPDSADQYLSDGLTEDLINTLGQSPDLRVVARTSAFAFKG